MVVEPGVLGPVALIPQMAPVGTGYGRPRTYNGYWTLLTEFSSTFSRLLIAAVPKIPKALSARGLKITVPWYPFARPTLEENGGHAWRLDAAGL